VRSNIDGVMDTIILALETSSAVRPDKGDRPERLCLAQNAPPVRRFASATLPIKRRDV